MSHLAPSTERQSVEMGGTITAVSVEYQRPIHAQIMTLARLAALRPLRSSATRMLDVSMGSIRLLFFVQSPGVRVCPVRSRSRGEPMASLGNLLRPISAARIR